MVRHQFLWQNLDVGMGSKCSYHSQIEQIFVTRQLLAQQIPGLLR